MKNKLLALVFLPLAIAGCEKRAGPSAVESARVGNKFLDTYADELVKHNNAQIASFAPSFETLHSPLSYLTVFQSNDPNMLTSEVEDGDSAGLTRNSDITLRWRQMYCSDALQSLMQREGIALAAAQIVDASGKKHSLAMCVATSASANEDFTKKLDAYGQALVASVEPGVLKYVEAKQTMSAPLISYLATFSTEDATFFSNPKGATDKVAYFENSGKRLVWETKFCTDQLRDLMRAANINLVNGQMVNQAGEVQFLAMCTRD